MKRFVKIRFLLFFIAASVFALPASGKTILSVSGLGRVNANPAGRTLTFFTYGGPMEFSVCYNTLSWMPAKGLYVGPMRCLQGEVGGWAKAAFKKRARTIKMPHYRTFIVTISRYSKIGVAICRENDGRLGCVHIVR